MQKLLDQFVGGINNYVPADQAAPIVHDNICPSFYMKNPTFGTAWLHVNDQPAISCQILKAARVI